MFTLMAKYTLHYNNIILIGDLIQKQRMFVCNHSVKSMALDFVSRNQHAIRIQVIRPA